MCCTIGDVLQGMLLQVVRNVDDKSEDSDAEDEEEQIAKWLLRPGITKQLRTLIYASAVVTAGAEHLRVTHLLGDVLLLHAAVLVCIEIDESHHCAAYYFQYTHAALICVMPGLPLSQPLSHALLALRLPCLLSHGESQLRWEGTAPSSVQPRGR